MSDDGRSRGAPDGGAVDWPVDLRGITETVVTTLGPNGRWNAAALGVHAPSGDGSGPATATTWGRTRTRRNFEERNAGYVQFTRDPVDFVEAALSIRETDDPVLDGVAAWARVEATRRDGAVEDGTERVEWALRPVEAVVERETVPTTNRGYNAVVEATVAASRLDVDAYERATLLDRLAYLESVARRCGGSAERAAFDRLADVVDAEW